MSSADQDIQTATAGVRVVEALERLGVEVVFGLPGVHNLAIWKGLSESAIRLIGVRHEQAAVYAADGHARVTVRHPPRRHLSRQSARDARPNRDVRAGDQGREPLRCSPPT